MNQARYFLMLSGFHNLKYLLEKTKSGLWGAVNLSLRRYTINVYFLAIIFPFFTVLCSFCLCTSEFLPFLFHNLSSSVSVCH